jgi:hypothetical protein
MLGKTLRLAQRVSLGFAGGFVAAASWAYMVDDDRLDARVRLQELREGVLRAIGKTAGGAFKRWNHWKAIGGEGPPLRGFDLGDDRNKLALSRESPLGPLTAQYERHHAAIATAAPGLASERTDVEATAVPFEGIESTPDGRTMVPTQLVALDSGMVSPPGMVHRVSRVMEPEQVRVAALRWQEVLTDPDRVATSLGLHRLQPGDHLAYSFMRGPGVDAWHHGVFIGEHPPRLVEVTGNGLVTVVGITTLESFLEVAARCGSPLYRIDYVSPQPPAVVVQRALWAVGKWPFNMLTENCEHFSTWASQGVFLSPQTSRMMLGEAQPSPPVEVLSREDDAEAMERFLLAVDRTQRAVTRTRDNTLRVLRETEDQLRRGSAQARKVVQLRAGKTLQAITEMTQRAATEVEELSEKAMNMVMGKKGPWGDVGHWTETSPPQPPSDHQVPDASPEQSLEDSDIEVELFGDAKRVASHRGCVCRASGCRALPFFKGGGAFCLIERGCKETEEEPPRDSELDEDSTESAGGWPARAFQGASDQWGRITRDLYDRCDADQPPQTAKRDPRTQRWSFTDTRA